MLLYISFFVILLKYGECNEDNKLEVYNELPCSIFSADCVMEKDCPSNQLVPLKGMCPTQEKYGVKCCFGSYDQATKCNRRGGECFPKPTNCPDFLTVREPGVCSDDEICCILV